MRITLLFRALFIAFVSALVAPALVGAAEEVEDKQVVTIEDTRAGTGPCGFAVQRELEGAITITPRIDDTGQLVLTISKVDMYGILTNPENGKSVEIRWVQQNGGIGFVTNGASIDVLLGIDGTLFRGYDTASSELTLDLPADGAEFVEFTPGDRHEDPWAHVCGLLA